MTARTAAGRPGAPRRLGRVPPGRLLAVAVLGLAVAAAALWGASRGTWVTAVWDTPQRGRAVATATGAATEPTLVPWALLALAAVAGVLATSGWGRRAVGAVVALAGGWALLRALAGLAAPSPEALPAPARLPGRLVSVDAGVGWPLLAAAGGFVLLAVGVLVVGAAARLPRLGARYEAPGGGSRPGGPAREPDPWAALDAGQDPTVTGPEPDPPHGGPGADHPSDRPPDPRPGPGRDRRCAG